MRIDDTDAWTTASEAARLLDVSPQRVQQMADDGIINVLRPWPHVSLVSRRSIAEWLAGDRPEPIRPRDARLWMLKHLGVDDVQRLDIDTVRDEMRAFIEFARPLWDSQRKDLWALSTAPRLFRIGAPA